MGIGKRLAAGAVLLGAITIGGCSTMKPGNLATVEPVTSSPRVGNVFLFRGIVGIFSTGLDHLGDQINAAGVHADVYQDDQWNQLANTLVERYQRRDDAEPLVLIGHSWGADHIIEIAQRLDAVHVSVALILTLDPVTPPAVPGNVVRCENLYESNGIFDVFPFFRGVPLTSATNATVLLNYDLHSESLQRERPELYQPGTNHFSIEKQDSVHNEVIKQILAICPTRAEWFARKSTMKGMLVAAPATQPAKVQSARSMASAGN